MLHHWRYGCLYIKKKTAFAWYRLQYSRIQQQKIYTVFGLLRLFSIWKNFCNKISNWHFYIFDPPTTTEWMNHRVIFFFFLMAMALHFPCNISFTTFVCTYNITLPSNVFFHFVMIDYGRYRCCDFAIFI